MPRIPLALTLLALAATLYLLATEPVGDWRECRDPGVYRWQYDRDVCVPQPK